MRPFNRSILSFVTLTAMASACTSAAPQRPTTPPIVVGSIDTPIDLAAGLTLERVASLAIERHPIHASEGAPALTAQDREAHARDLRHEASLAYAAYYTAWRTLQSAHHHVETVASLASLTAARAQSAAVPESFTERAAVARARADMAAVHATWELDRAEAALNALLVRPADAPLGPPADEVARSIALPIEELVTRATHHHTPDPQDPEAPLLMRGQIAEALDQLRQLEREWTVLRDGALTHTASLERSLPTWVSASPEGVFTALAVAQELTDIEDAHTSIVAQLIDAAADLEQAVGEALPLTPLPEPPPPPAVVSAPAPPPPPPASESTAPATAPATAAPAPAHPTTAHPAPHARPHAPAPAAH